MPISPYYKPQTPKYTSQFVEQKQPTDLLMQVGQQKQQMVDQVRNLASESQEQLEIDVDPRLSKSYQIAKQREKAYENAIQESIKEFNQTGNVRKATRQIQNLNRSWQNDPIKRQAEQQTKKFREDQEEYLKMRQEGVPESQIINKWMQEGKITPGYAEEKGFIQPQGAGVIKGTTNEEIRSPFEEKMNVKSQTVEYDGKTVTARPRERMFAQVGLNEVGEFTGQTEQEFNNWVADIGWERLAGYLQQTGRIGQDASPEEMTNAAKNLYKDTAKEVADRYWQNDIRRDEDGGDETDEGLPGSDWFTDVDETYRYSLPGIEQTLGTEKITQMGEEDIMDLPPENLQTIMDVQNNLINNGVLDRDLDFEDTPNKNNFVYLKELLNNKINDVELSEDQIDDMTDLIGPDAHESLGNLQTKNEIKNMKPEQAREILNKINEEETKVYQGKISEKDAPEVKANAVLDLFQDEQSDLSRTNFGQQPIIDATKGINVRDYIDRGELQPRKLVTLPLEVTEDGQWRELEGGEHTMFLEARGKIDPSNMSDTEKQRYLAASREEIPEGLNISSQLQEDEDIVKTDKLLIPINVRIANQIIGSTKSDRLKRELEEEFGGQSNLRTEEFSSENL